MVRVVVKMDLSRSYFLCSLNAPSTSSKSHCYETGREVKIESDCGGQYSLKSCIALGLRLVRLAVRFGCYHGVEGSSYSIKIGAKSH